VPVISQQGFFLTQISSPPKSLSVDKVDTSYLQTLIGYNSRRAALAVISVFMERMAAFGLRPVDFSVMSVITHNPGVTSRQLCSSLNILPPNLVGLIQSLEAQGLLERQAHPHDGRAVGLHPTSKGVTLMKQAEATASELEMEVGSKLTPTQVQTLVHLLQKIYL
jgi:DNA-binding MarR family transcriptional regulator